MSTVAERENGEEETEEGDANEETPQAPTGREATRMCNQLQLYLCAQGASEKELKALDSTIAFVEKKQKRQTAMTQFFTLVP